MYNLNYKNGITIISLVVTVTTLLIISGITISTLLDNQMIELAENNVNESIELENNEKRLLKNIINDLEEKRIAKNENNSLREEPVLNPPENTMENNNENTMQNQTQETPQEQNTKISEHDIEDVRNKIKNSEIQIVEYEPKTTNKTVTIEAKYNGNIQDQVFTQENIGAVGQNKVNWQVLSINENNVKLVSTLTNAEVSFKNSAGYDNSLYYLNKISKELFCNENFGVKEEQVHAFRLSDIKEAAEQINQGYTISNRDWNWETDFENNATTGIASSYNKEVTYSKKSNNYFPAIYKADEKKNVITNNSKFDEDEGSLTENDSGIKRKLNDASNPAKNLTIKNTGLGYSKKRNRMLANLGPFGESNICKKIFKTNEDGIWLASRCIVAGTSEANYSMRIINNGTITNTILCSSSGSVSTVSNKFRIVIEVPASNVKINNGIVSIK